jgi:hypothetical protein
MSMESHRNTNEESQSLWALVVPPSIWFAYFLCSYAFGALWCGGPAGRSFAPVRFGLAALSLPVLAVIGLAARDGWRRHSHSGSPPPHDKDTPEDRHQFLGFATLLLALLSAVATVYVALGIVVTRRCF